MSVLNTIKTYNTQYKGDKLDDMLKGLTSMLPSLRKEIRLLSEDQRKETISELDALVSLPTIILILDDLREKYEEEIKFLFLDITKAPLKIPVKKNETLLENIFVKYINETRDKKTYFYRNKSLKEIFDNDLLKNDKKTVNEKTAMEFYDTLIQETLEQFLPPKTYPDSEQKKLLETSLRSGLFLINVIKSYTIANDKQRGGIKEIIGMIGEDEQSIRRPLELLGCTTKQCTQIDDTADLWSEAELWLLGLYHHTFKVMPKNENNEVIKIKDPSSKDAKPKEVYPTIPSDEMDASLFKYFHITKYDISIYYKNVANGIHFLTNQAKKTLPIENTKPAEGSTTKITQVLNTVSEKPMTEPITKETQPVTPVMLPAKEAQSPAPVPAKVTQSPAPVPAKETRAPEVITPKPNDSQQPAVQVSEIPNQAVEPAAVTAVDKEQGKQQPGILRNIAKDQDNDDNYIVSFNVPKTKKASMIEQLTKFGESIAKSGRLVVDENVVPDILKKYRGSTDKDMQIRHLGSCLNKYNLTSKQLSALDTVPGAIDDFFTKYENDGYSWWYLFGWFQRTHAQHAKNVLLNVKEMENPQDQLLELFKIRSELVKKTSRQLLPDMDKILLDAFETISGFKAEDKASPRQSRAV